MILESRAKRVLEASERIIGKIIEGPEMQAQDDRINFIWRCSPLANLQLELWVDISGIMWCYLREDGHVQNGASSLGYIDSILTRFRDDYVESMKNKSERDKAWILSAEGQKALKEARDSAQKAISALNQGSPLMCQCCGQIHIGKSPRGY